MIQDLNNLAREIIEKNQYLTIATVDSKGNPWASPVAYSFDENYNFYFASIPSSKHCQNLQANEKVIVAIFDSHQLFSEGVGLQIESIIKGINFSNTPLAVKNFFSRKYPYGSPTKSVTTYLKRFLKKGELYRFYKITPVRVWMNNPNVEIDERVEINLKLANK